MSRLEEVENSIRWAMSNALAGNSTKPDMVKIARTLAAEVDELQAKLDQVRSEIGCARGQRTTQFCADLERTMKERDELQRRLDAIVKMLEPGLSHATALERAIAKIRRVLHAHARAVAIAEGRDNG